MSSTTLLFLFLFVPMISVIMAWAPPDFVTSMMGVKKSVSYNIPHTADLDRLVQSQVGSILNLRLDIHNKGNAEMAPLYTHKDPVVGMSVTGLSVELNGEELKGKSHVPMESGRDRAASGFRALKILETGGIVDMTGTVKLPIDRTNKKPAWEFGWNKHAMHGSLVCGLDMTKGINRISNKFATIPEGPTYVSFQVWKRDDLTHYQERKAEVLQKGKEYLDTRDEELMKMQMTNNVFQKANHYRKAAAAIEQYSFYPVREYSTNVPDDKDVIQLTDDAGLFISKVGTVWRPATNSQMVGSALMGLRTMKHELLGSAFITSRVLPSTSDEDKMNQEMNSSRSP